MVGRAGGRRVGRGGDGTFLAVLQETRTCVKIHTRKLTSKGLTLTWPTGSV